MKTKAAKSAKIDDDIMIIDDLKPVAQINTEGNAIDPSMFENPMDINKNISAFLTKMMKKYELEKNKGKVFGYRRAINGLNAYREPITDVK